MKTCRKCGEQRPLDDFYVHPKMADGHLNACKACVKGAVRADRRVNDRVREYDRKRGSRRPHAATQEYRAKNPEAYQAHTAVSNAVRDGRLRKEPCLFCGEARVHGHHRDYSKPLEVVWLCAKCHHRLHAYFPETAAHERAREDKAP